MSSFKPTITQELKDTLKGKEGIVSKVYWDKNGRHYFYVFNLKANEESKEEEQYGMGKFSHNKPVKGEHIPEGVTEPISYGEPGSKIVGEMDYDDVMKYEISSTSEEEIYQNLAKIGITREAIEAMKSMGAKSSPPPAAAEDAPKNVPPAANLGKK